MNKIEKWSLNGLKTSEAQLHSVYDGDTLRLILPVCCKKYIFSCRLNGLDTPEIRSKNVEEKSLAYKVRDYVRELLKDTPFRVECLKFDKYGRVLCNVFININDVDVSLAQHLIDKKYAYAYDGGKKIKFEDWINL